MSKIEQCLITVDLAYALREVVEAMNLSVPNADCGFLCPECHKPVKPFKPGSTGGGAHFEHLTRHPECRLSHIARQTSQT
jgi:hypothetical protein